MHHEPVLDYTQMEPGHALYKETYETALSLGLPVVETLPLSYVPASKLSHLRTFGDYSITYAGRDFTILQRPVEPIGWLYPHVLYAMVDSSRRFIVFNSVNGERQYEFVVSQRYEEMLENYVYSLPPMILKKLFPALNDPDLLWALDNVEYGKALTYLGFDMDAIDGVLDMKEQAKNFSNQLHHDAVWRWLRENLDYRVAYSNTYLDTAGLMDDAIFRDVYRGIKVFDRFLATVFLYYAAGYLQAEPVGVPVNHNPIDTFMKLARYVQGIGE
jgi:hypothetical protein